MIQFCGRTGRPTDVGINMELFHGRTFATRADSRNDKTRAYAPPIDRGPRRTDNRTIVRLSNSRSHPTRKARPARSRIPSVMIVHRPDRTNRADTAGSGRVRRRADARKLEILRAASTVFRERGFVHSGMRDIATAANLSTANLYHYFRGKDEILFFCQNRSLDRMLAAVDAARTPGHSFTVQLRSILVFHTLCIIDDVEGSAAHLETDSLPPAMRTPLIRKRDDYEKSIRKLVSDGSAAGEFEVTDPVIATRAVLGALNWTARWFRRDGRYTPQAVAEQLADFIILGLAARRPAARARR